MTENVRNLFFVLVTGFAVTLNCSAKSEMKFTKLDLEAVSNLTEYLHPQCFVFVRNGEDVSLIKIIKNFSGSDFYFTAVNSTVLEKTLENNGTQLDFFKRKTVIVTKENLNLTSLLSQIYVPHFITWIIFGDYTLLQKLYIPVSCEVIFIHTTSRGIKATQVYHLKQGTKETVKILELRDSPELSHHFLQKTEKINFHKVSMKMLVINNTETCRNVPKEENLLKKMECYHQDFLALMAERLNFSINPIECIDKEHLFTYPNGSDSELFLRLKNSEVDFSAVSHVVRARGNRTYMDFVWPTVILKTMMYLKQGRLTGRWVTYLRPLENSVWWGILVWILVAGILIQIFEKMLKNQLKFNISLVLDLISSTLNALQVFCNQAMADIPSFYSIRIIYFWKFFVVLIFFQAYCAYLVSSLTIVVSRFPFTDLKGFFANRQYQIMTLRKGFHHFYFKKVAGVGQREDFMLPEEDLPVDIQQAVDKLCEQNYVAFTEFRESLLNFNTLKCKISELPSPVVSVFIGIGMPKQQPIKEFLRRELLYIKSTGIAKKLRSRLSSRSDLREEQAEDNFTPVSLAQIFSIFIFLGMGALLSLAIFGVEVIIWRKKRMPLLGSRRKMRKFGVVNRYVKSTH